VQIDPMLDGFLSDKLFWNFWQGHLYNLRLQPSIPPQNVGQSLKGASKSKDKKEFVSLFFRFKIFAKIRK
jgi:hypothetical protein